MRAPEPIGRRRTVARAVLVLASASIVAALAGAAAARPVDEPASVPDRLIFPIVGPATWSDDFGDARAQGGHEGNDILSDWRSPVVAVEPGKVRLYTKSERAGCMLYLYGKSGTTYLYIHLNDDLTRGNDARGGCKAGVAYAEGLADGDRVQAGQVLGYIGSSGDAGATNHLHFELHPDDGAAISPFRWLKRADRLLFAPPAEGPALLAASEPATLTLTGKVKKVEVVADGEPPEPPADPAAGEPETAPAAGASPSTGTSAAGQTPVLIGRATETTLLTIHLATVELSTGGSWEVERDVTLTVPAAAVVERENGAKVKRAKLDSAEVGESVTVTTGAIELSLKWQLARPGVLEAAQVLLQGTQGGR